jgi:hypothetical protein
VGAILAAHPEFALRGGGRVGSDAILSAASNLQVAVLALLKSKRCALHPHELAAVGAPPRRGGGGSGGGGGGGALDATLGGIFGIFEGWQVRTIYDLHHPEDGTSGSEGDGGGTSGTSSGGRRPMDVATGRRIAAEMRRDQAETVFAMHRDFSVPINFTFGHDASTTLMMAMAHLFFNVTRTLVNDFGANPHFRNVNGETALTMRVDFMPAKQIYAENKARFGRWRR